MKPTLVVLLALCPCLTVVGAGKEKRIAGEKAGYKGWVMSVKWSKFKIMEKFGEPVKKGDVSLTYKYDKKGNEAAVKVVSVGAIIIMDTYICKYDGRGNKISKHSKSRAIPSKKLEKIMKIYI